MSGRFIVYKWIWFTPLADEVDDLFRRVGDAGLAHRGGVVAEFVGNRAETRRQLRAGELARAADLAAVDHRIIPAMTGTVMPFFSTR